MREERLRHVVFNSLFSFVGRWKVRRLPLVCPNCLERASEATFARGRWLVAEKNLHCDACGVASDIAGWRLAAACRKKGERSPSLSEN